MKKIKFFSVMLLLATMFIGFNACSDDDDDNDKNSIVGKWKLLNSDGDVHTHLEFKSNGTFEYTSTEDADYKEVGDYRIEGDILSQMFSDEDYWHTYKITELTSTSLKLVDGYDDGDPYIFRYSRVN